MFSVLHAIEARLPELLSETAAWQSKYIDYSPPLTERIFRDVNLDGNTYRVYLHRIHPCDRAFFHPHPWPSAMRVIGGPGATYEMGVGFSANSRHEPPPHACVIRVPAGFEYEMTHPDGWHYVRVIGQPSVSLMVSGPLWERDAPRTERHVFRNLTDEEQAVIIGAVQHHYNPSVGPGDV